MRTYGIHAIKPKYHFTFTWSDGETFEIDSTDSWTAQNMAHWERYGKYGTPSEERAELTGMNIEPLAA